MKFGGPGKCEYCGEYVDNLSFHRIMCDERDKELTTNNKPNKVMKRVMIETPLMARGERTMEMNLVYARECVRDSLTRKEAPFAMHVFYTQVLNDNITAERALGMTCGLAWLLKADAVILYCDYGVSSGMKAAYKKALANNIEIELRFIKDHNEKIVQQVKCDLFDGFLEDATLKRNFVKGT